LLGVLTIELHTLNSGYDWIHTSISELLQQIIHVNTDKVNKL